MVVTRRPMRGSRNSGDMRGGPESLMPALRRLDGLLEGAIAVARSLYGPAAATDPFRGLHIGHDEVARLMARSPGVPMLHSDGAKGGTLLTADALAGDSPLGRLRGAFGLSLFDLDLVLIALAPEIDLRYERLYAYLQDDVTRRRPSVDLALNLLCPSVESKIARRVHWAPDAPLVRNGLICLFRDPNHVEPTHLGHYFRLDEQIVRLLLGLEGMDTRLAGFCERVEPTIERSEPRPLPEVAATLSRLAARARQNQEPLSLYFQGPPGSGKRATAEALARALDAPLLIAELSSVPAGDTDFQRLLPVLFRQAWLDGAVLYLQGMDALRLEEQARRSDGLMARLAAADGITILAGTRPWVEGPEPTGTITVRFPVPGSPERLGHWQASLASTDIGIEDRSLDALANRFRLTPGQIRCAVASARGQARWQAACSGKKATRPRLTAADLFAGARAQSGHDLGALAQKVQPNYKWADIVLPADALTQLREICQWVIHRQRVLGEWGFERKLSSGKGVTALFAGPSGTGKTMAAEIIANELGVELYRIDLSGVVSKYIGETEKNLERIFTAAENANAILFFDEADALFGRRSEVHDSHDRYANIEISYLLQRMEQYEGITVLATNLRQNLDESFVRRLAFTVHFPFPDETDRRCIWAGIWPAETPVAADVDLGALASRFKLSGGNIKNIALSSSFLAAADGGVVRMEHLLHAAQREYQKIGKVLSSAELHGAQVG